MNLIVDSVIIILYYVYLSEQRNMFEMKIDILHSKSLLFDEKKF